MEAELERTSLTTFIERQLENPFKMLLWIVVVTFLSSAALVTLPFRETGSHGAQPFLHPEDALALKGQEVYFQEGCHYCHTQLLRPMQHEVARFSDVEKLGYYPLQTVMEYNFEAPFAAGSRRIGPDLSRAATLYNEAQLRSLLTNREAKSLKQRLHSYGYLFQEEQQLEARPLSWKIRILLQARLPLSDAFQRSLFTALEEQRRGDALIAYLLSRGKKQMQFGGKYYVKE